MPLVEASTDRLCLAQHVQVDVHRVIAVARGAFGDAPSGELCFGDDFDGELLPDWYDEWLEAERERVRQLKLHAIELHAERLFDAGRYGEAVDAFLLAVGIEPLRDCAHRMLVKIFLAEGNESEALRHYSRYARRLDDDLGLKPSTQMTDIVRELVA